MDEKRVKEEEKRLLEIFNCIPIAKKNVVLKLIKRASFTMVTLEELEKDIKVNGAIITGANGNGIDSIRENPAQHVYTQLLPKYAAIIKQLTDLLPSDKDIVETEAKQSLIDFINAGKKVTIK